MTDSPRLLALQHQRLPDAEMRQRAARFAELMRRRRSVREFASEPVDREIIEHCLRAAGAAPSGANLQPWHFVVVSDPQLKAEIRRQAEIEEREFYQRRAPQQWLDALAPIGVDANKPFLEQAPHLIVIFRRVVEQQSNGQPLKQYYSVESVGIATGMLITALHDCGLVTLTHTPSPMQFLNQILGRPSNERPFLILVAGHPAADATVPDLSKKPLDEISTFL